MKKLFEFLFFRWKKEILERGEESWFTTTYVSGVSIGETNRYRRNYIDYILTNKFDGSTKIKREYLN